MIYILNHLAAATKAFHDFESMKLLVKANMLALHTFNKGFGLEEVLKAVESSTFEKLWLWVLSEMSMQKNVEIWFKVVQNFVDGCPESKIVLSLLILERPYLIKRKIHLISHQISQVIQSTESFAVIADCVFFIEKFTLKFVKYWL